MTGCEKNLDSPHQSGYNDSGVGKDKDPWRSYESGTTNNPYAYL